MCIIVSEMCGRKPANYIQCVPECVENLPLGDGADASSTELFQ